MSIRKPKVKPCPKCGYEYSIGGLITLDNGEKFLTKFCMRCMGIMDPLVEVKI